LLSSGKDALDSRFSSLRIQIEKDSFSPVEGAISPDADGFKKGSSAAV
jgi:hypothetical protein